MAVKSKSTFVCQSCGAIYPQWLGKCTQCGQWNSLVEEISTPENSTRRPHFETETPQPLDQVKLQDNARLTSGLQELDRVLGGGFVLGAVSLIGGDPGIGKSTLCLQISDYLARQGHPVLYVSGEESPSQIKLRANRLQAGHSNLFILSETHVQKIIEHIKKLKPQFVIIDSVQTLYRDEILSAPGSVSQVRECSALLWQFAKNHQLPLILVGHITKEGMIAGPKVLEHMVDTVLYFEGERHGAYRILRSIKNRFGSTHEIGIFEMTADGLKEVSNPSQLFLHEKSQDQSGSCVVATVEGSRPLLVEVQALVTPGAGGMSRRTVTGADPNRAAIIIATLEKKAGLHLGPQDIFINVVGGIKVLEPAADLGIALAIASSFKNIPIRSESIAIGEIGLTGEIRSVSHLEQRLHESHKLGFRQGLIPASQKLSKSLNHFQVEPIKDVAQALEYLE